MYSTLKKLTSSRLVYSILIVIALLLAACQPAPVEPAAPGPDLDVTPLPYPLPGDPPTPPAPELPETGLTPTPLATPETVVTPEVAEEIEVTMTDAAFQPEEITVAPGTTVTWTTTGTLPHTVTAEDGSFDSGTLQPGSTFSFTFNEPGRYPYYCALHGAPGGVGMSGVIVVEE